MGLVEERYGVHTCQAAEGQGPGGLVCWWLRSQTHPECYEAHPAQPGAEIPPCNRGVKASVSLVQPQPLPGLWCLSLQALSTGLPAESCPVYPSMQSPILSVPHPMPQSLLFSIKQTISEPEGQELLGL